jgi:hypothetical protein
MTCDSLTGTIQHEWKRAGALDGHGDGASQMKARKTTCWELNGRSMARMKGLLEGLSWLAGGPRNSEG